VSLGAPTDNHLLTGNRGTWPNLSRPCRINYFASVSPPCNSLCFTWEAKLIRDLRTSSAISTPHNPTLRYIFVPFGVDKDFHNLAVGILLRPQRGVVINIHGGGRIAMAHELLLNAYRSASFINQ